VVPDETLGEQDPLLAKLLAAATAGAAPAGSVTKRQPIRIVLDPDDRPIGKGVLCGRLAQLSGATSGRACWGRLRLVLATPPSRPLANPRAAPSAQPGLLEDRNQMTRVREPGCGQFQRTSVVLAAAFLVATGCGGRTALLPEIHATGTGGSRGGDAPAGADRFPDSRADGNPDAGIDAAPLPDLATEGSPELAAEVGADIGQDRQRDQGAGDEPAAKPDGRDGPDTAMDTKPEVGDGDRGESNRIDLSDAADAAEVERDVGSEAGKDAGGEVRAPMLRLIAGGLGGPGDQDGSGAVARFDQPRGVAYDGAGNLFVADDGNNTVRKVVIATGAVTTVAGSPGSHGTADGNGANARFWGPAGVACYKAGNLFVADTGNNTIRKIVIATGNVTTLAGAAGTAGSADGTGTAASFNYPKGIVVSDSQGELFVADTQNHTIRKIVIATGAVTTLAGSPADCGSTDGTGAAARFNLPSTMVGDGLGNLFVADSASQAIRKVVIATGEVTTLAGSWGSYGSTDGIGAKARFYDPYGITSDGAGNLFVTEDMNNTIRKVVIATGEVTTLAGSPLSPGSTDGIRASARFNGPMGVSSDGAGNLFVADFSNATIRKVVIATGEVTTFAGSPPLSGSTDGMGTNARFSIPGDLTSDGAGNLFVADSYNYTIRKIVIATGEVTTLAGSRRDGSNDGIGTTASFDEPWGITGDRAGDLFVADSVNSTIRKIVIATAEVTTFAGAARSPGTTDGTASTARFNYPASVAIDGMGNLFVADGNNRTIRQVVMATGAVTTLAGSPGSFGYADGTGAAAQFTFPMGLTTDGDGNLFVADSNSHTVRKIVIATGAVTTLAGSPTIRGSSDGTGADARFDNPAGTATDGAGNLFVADHYNHTVRKIVLATGAVSTVVGTPDRHGIVPGPLPAKLACPSGLAFGPGGDLFITDTCENVVLMAQF
jgi:hypothetical protein